VPDSSNSALSFAPVLCEQESAAPFSEPVDLKRSPAISRPLYQALFAQAKKVGMQLAAATERQIASDLTGVMPAPVSQRFEHQASQFSVLPHKRILPAFVSTLLFVKGTRTKTKQRRGIAKACTLRKYSTREFACKLFRFFFPERFLSNVRQI
jgi:hypothetical protein